MSDDPKWRKPSLIVKDFRAICRANGYALAEHGSRRRDVDLIAVPWTPKAILSGALLKHLAEVEGVVYAGDPSGKPHGRIALVIMGLVVLAVLEAGAESA